MTNLKPKARRVRTRRAVIRNSRRKQSRRTTQDRSKVSLMTLSAALMNRGDRLRGASTNLISLCREGEGRRRSVQGVRAVAGAPIERSKELYNPSSDKSVMGIHNVLFSSRQCRNNANKNKETSEGH